MVRTDEVAVQVLGTSFNVSAYQSEQMARVTLVGGSVAVKANGGEEFRIVPPSSSVIIRKAVSPGYGL